MKKNQIKTVGIGLAIWLVILITVNLIMVYLKVDDKLTRICVGGLAGASGYYLCLRKPLDKL